MSLGRLSLLFATVSLALLCLASPAGAAFGIASFESRLRQPGGAEETQAGAHPYDMAVAFQMNGTTHPDFGETVPDGNIRNLVVDLPPGFVGDPTGTPTCSSIQLAGTPVNCPINSQIGAVVVGFANGSTTLEDQVKSYPVFNLEPHGDQVARFGFNPLVGVPVTIAASVRSDTDYGVRAEMVNVPQAAPFIGSRLELWGIPAASIHDLFRGPAWNCSNDFAIDPASCAGGGISASIEPKAFLTMPASCGGPLESILSVDSWQNPGAFASSGYTTASGLTGCDKLRFEPQITVRPTTNEADSPTGLDVDLAVPQNPNPNGYATAHVKDSVVQLPEGMTVNPSAADGLVGCPEADFGLHTKGLPGCPDASKIGTVEIESELVREDLVGHIYQAKQSENPFGSILGFYTYAKGPGLEVKLAAKVVTDPVTGRVTTIFEDSPQLPFDHYRLHFNGGPRAPLRTPSTCGVKTAEGSFTSWAAPATEVRIGDSFQITSGPGGAPCANTLAERPHTPKFTAGSVNPIAGAFSTFALDVSREDGTQELRTISTTLPPGMLAELAGVPYCPESAIAAAGTSAGGDAALTTAPGTGLAEKLNPSCPAASLIGHTDAAAGAGALPFHNPGNVYLTGPRGGAPLSLAIVTPIVAGPLDLGSIVVRASMFVDPQTAQVRVVSDSLPERIVAEGNGFPLNLRSVRVTMDRDGFTLNPTSCDPMSVDGAIGSLQGASATVSDRFQVGACAALGFKPHLGLRLLGGTKRGAHPRLRAVLRMPRENQANIARTAVTLPRSAFLDQGHLDNVCTRVRFAADECPKGSIYGRAVAHTPLLDQPLRGPVYLRSSSNKLPDLVAALNGQIGIELVGRIDSVRGGIRTTFDVVPDAPVSKFVLTMKGGDKGLIQNSADLCAARNRATVKMDAHSGKIRDSRPLVKNDCAKRDRGKRGDHGGGKR